jgi:hypothetical protein
MGITMIFGVWEVEFCGDAGGATTVGPIMVGATVGVDVGVFVGAVVVTGEVELEVVGAVVGEGDTMDGFEEVDGAGAEESEGEGADDGAGAITGDALVEDAGSDIWEEDALFLSAPCG